jgi:hypothetical protein
MDKLKRIISLSNKKTFFEAVIFFFFIILVFLLYMNIIALLIKLFNPQPISIEKANNTSEVIADFFKIGLAILMIVKKGLFKGVINILLLPIAILIIWLSTNDYVLSFLIITIFTLLENKKSQKNSNIENEKV